MSIIPFPEAKARPSEIADVVYRTHERAHVTRNGQGYVDILAAEDLESLEATLELLGDPAAQQRVAESESEFARGEGVTLDQMSAAMEVRHQQTDQARSSFCEGGRDE